MEFSPDDTRDLIRAAHLLENPGFVAKLSDVVGTPVEAVLDRLPKGMSMVVNGSVRKSLVAALRVALRTMSSSRRPAARSWPHVVAAGATGAAGGAFGLSALAVELPVTTTIIMRSVATIARSQGEDLSTVATRLACLEVFAFGGRSTSDDATESGYFAVRAALAQAVTEAARYMAQKTTVEEGAPVIIRLLAQLAARFNTVVAEKIVAQGVPVIGALGGATVNMLFMNHFQDMARGHFVVRRLERAYGAEAVQAAYSEVLGGFSA